MCWNEEGGCDLGNDGLHLRPETLHSGLLLQVFHRAVPVKVDDPQGSPRQPLADRAHALREVLGQQQLILSLPQPHMTIQACQQGSQQRQDIHTLCDARQIPRR